MMPISPVFAVQKLAVSRELVFYTGWHIPPGP